MKIPSFLIWISALWTIGFWLICIAIPLTAVFIFASSISFGHLVDPVILAHLKMTLWQSGISTLISAGIGLPLGLWVGRAMQQSRSLLSSRLQILLALPMVIPSAVAAMTWVAWFGRSGILATLGWDLPWIYTLKGVVLAHVFLNAPLIAVWVSRARARLKEDQFEAAQTLGAGSIEIWARIIWPNIRRSFAIGCIQTFVFCSMSFSLVLILGGGPPVQTLETALYEYIRYGSVDLSAAVCCAIWQLGVTLVPWLLLLIFQKREEFGAGDTHGKTASLPAQKEGVLAALACSFFLVPYLVLLKKESFLQLLNPGIWEEVRAAAWISLKIALGSSAGSVFTSVFAIIALETLRTKSKAIEKVVGVFLALPSGVSVLILSLGMWIAYGSWIDPFEGSLFGMILIQSTLFFPLSFRLLWPTVQGTEWDQLEAAVSLGASPFRAFFQVEWPRWKGPLLIVFATVSGASMGEVAAVSLFSSEKVIPLSLLMTRWMGHYRFSEAQGLAGLLLLISGFLMVSSFELGNRFSKLWASRLPFSQLMKSDVDPFP